MKSTELRKPVHFSKFTVAIFGIAVPFIFTAIGALLGILMSQQNQITKNAAAIVALQESTREIKADLIGVNRYNDFTKSVAASLAEIKATLEKHNEESRHRNQVTVWGGPINKAPKVREKPRSQ